MVFSLKEPFRSGITQAYRAHAFSRFAFSVAKARILPRPHPWRMNVAVTKVCQSRCRNCNSWQVGRSSGELTLEEFRRIGAGLPNLRWISLTGGEPTLRKDLAGIVEAFNRRKKLYMVNFSTNGLNQEAVLKAAREIFDLQIPRFVIGVSVDGPANISDSLRGGQGGSRKALACFKELVKLEAELNRSPGAKSRLKVFVSMTLFPENASSLGDFFDELEACEGFSPDRFHLNVGHSSSHFYGNAELLPFSPAEAVRSLRRRQRSSWSAQGWVEGVYQALAEHRKKISLPCVAVKSSFFLDSKGDVFPCTVWDRKLGNLRESGFSPREILDAESSRSLMHQAKRRQCPGCWSPCEAYQSIASYPLGAVWHSFFRK